MLLQCNFRSWALGHTTSVTLILPSDVEAAQARTHEAKAKFPILYLLHGGGDDGTAWLRYTAVEQYANDCRVAVVMPTSENKCFRNTLTAFPELAYEQDRVEDYETFFSKELPDWLSANFPISTAPENSYIAGLSMGGYGAAYHAFTRPRDYAAVGIFSPYLFHLRAWDPERRKDQSRERRLADITPDLIEPLKKIAAEGGTFPKVLMMQGSKDIPDFFPLYAELLQEYGADVTADNTTHEFGHEWPFWDICVHDFLNWMPRTDAYRDCKTLPRRM